MKALKNKQNLHIHSTFSDGKHTPEELVQEALCRGFASIGFSEHSYVRLAPTVRQLTPEKTGIYKQEIRTLKEKYRGEIDIFCGLEFEFYAEEPLDGYDYVIGTVHYLDFDGQILGFDRKLEEVLIYLQTHFGGDGMAFAKKYYETLAHLPERGDFDVLGHFDVPTKNNELGHFIDTTDPAYIRMGLEAIHALKGKIPLFEVNTGAISRGYRTSPYPQREFVEEFYNCGYGAVLSTDCHNKAHLDTYFEEARQLLREAGYTTRWILTDDGFKEVEL